MRRPLLGAALFASALLFAPTTRADEGMWTLNDFPSALVKQRYGVDVGPELLTRIKGSAVRIAGGCSASIVSPNGLVMTNHHCAHSCIEHLSTAKKDFITAGFYAKTPGDEQQCAAMEIDQLQDISDVSARINAATQNLTGKAYYDALKATMSKVEKECATDDKVRCDVMTLWHGGRYDLYRYRRFQDVRLVFAPEFPIAFFGGTPDNFEFPRYDLDVAFLRIYDDKKPAQTSATYYPFSDGGAKDGEFTLVTGNPGKTDRLLTLDELEYMRDFAIPRRLLYLAQLRGMILEYQTRGPEQHRHANAALFGTENSFKAYIGREETLRDKTFWAQKTKEQQALRDRVKANAKLQKAYGASWDTIAQTLPQLRAIAPAYTMIEEGDGFHSDVFNIAKMLLRLSEELPKPNEQRFREYADSNLPVIKARLFSKAPLYDEFEIEKLTFGLERMRDELGVNSPLVRKILGLESPRELATRLIKGSKLKDVAVRHQLFDGGRAALDGSKDPMLAFARMVDVEARAIRKKFEDEIESVLKQNDEHIARARFELEGTKIYPDATLSLRVSYGQVKGWTTSDGTAVPAFTNLGGTYQRATGHFPFALPKSWLDAKGKLNLGLGFDFVTNNDIIGGNSGSAMIDKTGHVVGLVFDGNIESLGGDFWFDGKVNRTVAVNSAALLEALDKVYGAKRVLAELKPQAAPASGGATN